MPVSTPIKIITAPSSLGLRPNDEWLEPTTWQAPDVYLEAGLAEKLGAGIVKLNHPKYDFDAQFGTKIRNGLSIRAFSLQLAEEVEKALNTGNIPVVLGGDCSILLGCLLGAKKSGGRGLVHVDGHCDYFHPGNYNITSRPGTVAGMDLALATGKGELLLTHWEGVEYPLVKEEEAFHIGEKNFGTAIFEKSYGDIVSSGITVVPVQQLLKDGLENTAHDIVSKLQQRNLKKVWLHVDFDILDQTVMPAVDSPGSPGLNFNELELFLVTLLQSGLFAGLDFTIYDPGLDKEHRYLPALSGIIETCALQTGIVSFQ
jgi:arginase